MDELHIICDIIILLGGTFAAIKTIATMCGRPIQLFKKRFNKFEETKIKQITDDAISHMVDQLTPKFDEIKAQNKLQSEDIEKIMESSRDMLRESILQIYNRRRKIKKLTLVESNMLDKLFKDYENEDGNGEIKKLYYLMCKWEVVDPSELDEE